MNKEKDSKAMEIKGDSRQRGGRKRIGSQEDTKGGMKREKKDKGNEGEKEEFNGYKR